MNGPLAWGHAAVSFVHATPSVEEGFFFFFWPFLALLTVQLEECDRKQGTRGGVTCSIGPRARSRT